MAKITNEKLEKKRSRYSAVSIIMRQMYGVKFGYMPGYILLQDVIYKHLKNRKLPVKDLINWANEKFVAELTYDEAVEEIMLIVTQNLPESEGNDISLLERAIERATELYDKHVCYSKVSLAVRKMELPIIPEQEIIRILFELKRGKTLAEAIAKIADEDVDENSKKRSTEIKERKEELMNTIVFAFSSEMEMVEFALNLDTDEE